MRKTIATAVLAITAVLAVGCGQTHTSDASKASASSTSTTPSSVAPTTASETTTSNPRVDEAKDVCRRADLVIGGFEQSPTKFELDRAMEDMKTLFDPLGGRDDVGEVAVAGSMVNLDMAGMNLSMTTGADVSKKDIDTFKKHVGALMAACFTIGYTASSMYS